MGGSNDPSNLIEVSVEEHAELHFHLYLTYGKYADWVAYNMLSGRGVGSEEYRIGLAREALKGIPLKEEHKQKLSVSHRGKTIPKETREKISKTLTGTIHDKDRVERARKTRQKTADKKFSNLYKFSLDDGTYIEEYGTIRGLSKKYNIPRTTLRRRLCGNTK